MERDQSVGTSSFLLDSLIQISVAAGSVPGRPIIAVYHHVRRTYHPLKQQGKWMPAEDESLIQYVRLIQDIQTRLDVLSGLLSNTVNHGRRSPRKSDVWPPTVVTAGETTSRTETYAHMANGPKMKKIFLRRLLQR